MHATIHNAASTATTSNKYRNNNNNKRPVSLHSLLFPAK